MQHIKDLEEKKMIIAYYLAKNKKNVGLETVWRIWSNWWDKDFCDKGRTLTMYDHTLVLSKTKARAKVKAGESFNDYKEYDDFLADICQWIKDSYDNTVDGKTNTNLLTEKLFKYKEQCNNLIRRKFNKSSLKAEGYKLRCVISRRKPHHLSTYLLFNEDDVYVTQGTYENMLKYIDEMEECK